MKMSGMTSIIKKIAIPLVCGMLCATGTLVQAQGVIIGFKEVNPSNVSYTFLSPGSTVQFIVRLGVLPSGDAIIPDSGPTPLTLPTIQMRVGTAGDVRYATYVTWSSEGHAPSGLSGANARTDLVFEYVVQPGDMALPLLLNASPTIAYTIFSGDYTFRGKSTGVQLTAADWKVNTSLYNPAIDSFAGYAAMKLNLEHLDFKIQTIQFDSSVGSDPDTITASDTAIRRLKVATPIPAGETVDVRIWSSNPSVLQIVGSGLESFSGGDTDLDFRVRGLATGSATVYVQRQSDFVLNGVVGVTNFISRVFTVSPPPSPTVWIRFPDNMDLNTLNIDESSSLYPSGRFRIVLSETSPSNLYVRVDVDNIPTENNIQLDPNPFYMVPANQIESPVYLFSPLDGTVLSETVGVQITATVTNTPYYADHPPSLVRVRNVDPVVAINVTGDAIQGVPFNIGWNMADVTADISAGIIMEWNFGDSTPAIIETNTTSFGTIPHTYNSTLPKNGSVTVRETKNLGGLPKTYHFSVNVIPPPPTPSISVVLDKIIDNEGTNAWLRVVLSEQCSDSVNVTLTATLGVGGPDQMSNTVSFSSTTLTIPNGSLSNVSPIRVTFLDGTAGTANTGITITPNITGSLLAIGQYTTTNNATVYIENKVPAILNPASSTPTTIAPQYSSVPVSQPFTFRSTITDVQADIDAGFLVEWQIDGAGWQPGIGAGTTNAYTYTFSSIGVHQVEVRATDKDGGESITTTFFVNVINPPADPSVTVTGSFAPYLENGGGGSVTVTLSQSAPHPVSVDLMLTPPYSLNNPGGITLARTNLTFNPGQTLLNVSFSIQDGTIDSEFGGFTITPSISPLDTVSTNTFKVMNDGYVYIQNVAPVIQSPTPDSTNAVATVGIPYIFNFNIQDVAADRTYFNGILYPVTTWHFGDGQMATTHGPSGTVTNTYTAVSDRLTVLMETTDKDGGVTTKQFYIAVRDSKRVYVKPIGPNSSSFHGMPGTGYGTVSSPDALSPPVIGPDWIYSFYFAYGVNNVSFYAHPYDKGNAKSFFFAWDGPVENFIDPNHVTVPLSAGTTNGFTVLKWGTASTGAGAQQGAPVEAISISAIFSCEFYDGLGKNGSRDNCGDINKDGIPDYYVAQYFIDNPNMSGGGTGGGGGAAGSVNPVWFQNMAIYNDDGDYTPANPAGIGGVFDFRPIPVAGGGNNFTAFLECRGYDEFLGEQVDTTTGNLYNDDPGTDPTLADTDNDGLPDGWEYWFWERAYRRENGGWRYNPLNVGQGQRIESGEVLEAFDPRRPRSSANIDGRWKADFDNDGLLDTEELVLGTDPTNWDTDGDLMADGWEVLMGLNPCTSSDGLQIAYNNPDGDYFAIAAVERLLVTIVVTNDVPGLSPGTTVTQVQTNRYLARNDSGNPVAGTYTACYRYGDDNAPWAAGLPIAQDPDQNAGNVITNWVEVIDALLLHFQVRDEFGYDPRTAWCRSVTRGPDMPLRFGRGYVYTSGDPLASASQTRLQALAATYAPFERWGAFADSDAPFTRPFTAVDEYLLAKFMFELGVNGANNLTWEELEGNTTVVYDGIRSRGRDDWLRFTTHPRTPDTSATPYRAAGVPDGWKLYVATAPRTYGDFTYSPWNSEDGTSDGEGDDLSLQREFWATDTLPFYANPLQYSAVVPYAAGEIAPDNQGPENAVIAFRTGLTNSVSILSRRWTASMVNVITIVRPTDHDDNLWLNKFWPTDPWSIDTDGDGLCDDWESGGFIYGIPTDDGSVCIAGGGLNPCSVDTDRDGLPDGWELCFAGTLPPLNTAAPLITNGLFVADAEERSSDDVELVVVVGGFYIVDGMDGTVYDARQDWDRDGLVNHQEYMTQAIRGFRYDIPAAGVPATDADNAASGQVGLPMDMTNEMADLFTEVTNVWDQAQAGWPGVLWFMLPPETEGLRVYREVPRYASTDPRNADSDFDNMDDFYELFHGLNPLLGLGSTLQTDRIAWAYPNSPIWWDARNWWLAQDTTYLTRCDMVAYPWLNGMPASDPDADGLLNLEEALLANGSMPANYNTDPSPMWMTDSSNPNSITARFYDPLESGLYRAMYFWSVGSPMFLFRFEMNEGYDTDNDGISDKDELVGNRNSMSDPRNSEDPFRRQAMWFSGDRSAAVTPVTYHDWTSLAGWNYSLDHVFRSFTVELWARPERVTGSDQVLIERVFNYGATNSVVHSSHRRNFVIGIAADGRVYGGYDNAGNHDEHTDTARLFGQKIEVNTWTHLALRMDGSESKLTLFVNGIAQDTLDTALVPANGLLVERLYPTGSGGSSDYITTRTILSGALVLGAANDWFGMLGLLGTPVVGLPWSSTWADYSKFYQGWLAEVRVWNGARSSVDINGDYQRCLTYEEMMVNREQAVVFGDRDPQLMNYYTFNSLFSARDTAYVAQVPRGFNDPMAQAERPMDANVQWWASSPVASAVYTDRQYLPWIQNVIAHLPLFSASPYTNIMGSVSYVLDNVVADSIYWRTDWAGGMSSDNYFPNHNNPYGFAYGSRVNASADLLPLGGAWARQCPDFWDGQGPTGTWLENSDTTSDGLPQWWINLHNLTNSAWNALYSGTNTFYQNAGMENGEAYQRDLANGWQPDGHYPEFAQTADLDGDGMPDWWEKLYGLEPFDATGENGAGGDPDLDGLSNYAEYLISEVYQFRFLSPRKFKTNAAQVYSDYFEKVGRVPFGFIFSDHDFIEDWWEEPYAPGFANRYAYDANVDYDLDGWSNWAEARYSQIVRPVRPDTLGEVIASDGKVNVEMPIPIIKANLSYNGMQAPSNVVIHAYANQAMTGAPKATWHLGLGGGIIQAEMPLGPFAPQFVRTHLAPGHIVPNSIRFRFTHRWDGRVSNVSGFDREGLIYIVLTSDYAENIGTIDYDTGAITFDWSARANSGVIVDPVAWAAGDLSGILLYADCYADIQYAYSLPGFLPQTFHLGLSDAGYLTEGINYFVAFVDQSGNGAWDPGEPLGIATPFGTDIGWDMNSLDIQLSDYTPGYLRMSLSGTRTEDAIFGGGTGTGGGGGGQQQNTMTAARVRVLRTMLGGSSLYPSPVPVLDKIISGRDYIHEGDFLTNSLTGGFALDWGGLGNANSATYAVYVGGENDAANVVSNATLVTTFSNTYFTAYAAKAETIAPMHGAYVYSARPTFRWSMPDSYNAFAFEIRRNSTTAPLLYPIIARQVPMRDPNTGEYVWVAPFYAGDTNVVNNGIYYWRVAALNSKFSTATSSVLWSDWKMFRWDVNKPMQSAGYGQVNATVKYFGPANNLAGKVVLQAFDNRGFTGVPAAQYVFPAGAQLALVTNLASTATNAFMRGLTPGSYYLRAFIDSNGNGVRDSWESWGYGNYYGEQPSLYNARPVTVSFSTQMPSIQIIIEDCDEDQDWFPDSWEYEQNPGVYPGFLATIGPSKDWTFGNAEINPNLSVSDTWTGFGIQALLMAFATGSSQDQSDTLSMLAGLPQASGNKRQLGLLSSDSLGLRIVKNPQIDPVTAEVTWKLSIARDTSPDVVAVRGLVNSTATYTYKVRYSPSLDIPKSEWSTVKTGTIQFAAGEGEEELRESVSIEQIDETRGFFMIEVDSLPQN